MKGGGSFMALKKGICSPKKKEKITGFSCYTYDDLKYLKRLWNDKHPLPSEYYIKTNEPKEIYDLLYKYNIENEKNDDNTSSSKGEKNCPIKNANESCILNKKYVNEKVINQIKDFAFAPEAPSEWEKNPNEWLSTEEIEKVMKQYEKAYSCFKFMGPTPIDFDKRLGNQCVWNDICHFSLLQMLKEGKNKIGMIFNTDPHNKPGQHWISLFINIKRGQIFFFDSVGDKAPKEIKILVERIIEQGKKLNPPRNFVYDENHPVSHQKGDTECGIYSLFFIVHMLEDKITSYYLKHHILKDKYMEKFRKIYFN